MSVSPTQTKISLGIRPVWSESSLCAQCIVKDPSFLYADSEDPDQTGLMPRLIWVFAGRTRILLVLSCRGSFYLCICPQNDICLHYPSSEARILRNMHRNWGYYGIRAAARQTNNMACAPSKDSDQPGHLSILISVFAVLLKKPWVLEYPLSAQRKLWSEWADAQVDLCLRWAHWSFCWFCHAPATVWHSGLHWHSFDYCYKS